MKIITNFILGEAGTAKTTNIVSAICQLKDDFICLAYTHSAVNNLKKKYLDNYLSNHEANSNEIFDENFKTIHSYFKINLDKNGKEIFHSNLNLDLPSYIFIDELSLIPLHIIEFIYTVLNNNIYTFDDNIINITFVGDLLQLNPINIQKRLIDINNFKFLENFECSFKESLLIADHLSNNIFSTSYYRDGNKLILTKNFRLNNTVNQILNNVLDDYKNIYKYKIKRSEIKKYIENNYKVLASRYDYLEKIYKMINTEKQFKINTDIGEIYFNNFDKLLLTSNLNKDFLNGDTVGIIMEDNTIKIYKPNYKENENFINNNFIYTFEPNLKKYPLLPLNMLTIHKSQGLTLERVLIVVDEMFEITMLYTAITRASIDVKFILFNKSHLKQLKLYNQSFISMKNIIYS